jgi:hypothetical protein
MKSPSHWRPGRSTHGVWAQIATHVAYSGRMLSESQRCHLKYEFGKPKKFVAQKSIPRDGQGYREDQTANRQSVSNR